MSFIFAYNSVSRRRFDGGAELRFLGSLVSGVMSRNQRVLIPVIGGRPIESTISSFMEDFSDNWVALPFYNFLAADSISEPFCVCVVEPPLSEHIIRVPGELHALIAPNKGWAAELLRSRLDVVQAATPW